MDDVKLHFQYPKRLGGGFPVASERLSIHFCTSRSVWIVKQVPQGMFQEILQPKKASHSWQLVSHARSHRLSLVSSTELLHTVHGAALGVVRTYLKGPIRCPSFMCLARVVAWELAMNYASDLSNSKHRDHQPIVMCWCMIGPSGVCSWMWCSTCKARCEPPGYIAQAKERAKFLSASTCM